MDLDAFVAEHTLEWRRLEVLSGKRKRSVAEVDELMSLYQRAGTHLSAIRTSSPDPALVASLSRIVLTARGAVTGGSAFSWAAVARFLTEGFPLAVYQARRWWVPIGIGFTGLSIALMFYISSHPDIQNMLIPPADAQKLVNSGFSGYYSEYPAQHFALQVWTNNAFLTAQCLGAGILVLPVFYLLADNALNFGVDGGFMMAYGRSGEFWGLIAPHGLLELTCVYVAAGAGLRIGWAWIAPRTGLTRTRAVAEAARSAMLVALGLVIALGISGLLEAFVTPSPLPTFARVGIGFLVWLGFLAYVFLFGRRAHDAAASADLDESLREASLPSV